MPTYVSRSDYNEFREGGTYEADPWDPAVRAGVLVPVPEPPAKKAKKKSTPRKRKSDA